MTITTTLAATCHCGSVRLTLPAESADVLARHCTDCQKLNGNINAFLAAPVAEIAIVGAEALIWYQSSGTSRPAFCGTSGARLLKEVAPAGRWLVSAGLVDRPRAKRIVKNMWPQSKPDSYGLPEIPA